MSNHQWIIQAKPARPASNELEFLVTHTAKPGVWKHARRCQLDKVSETFSAPGGPSYVTLYEGDLPIGDAEGWTLEQVAARMGEIQTEYITDLLDVYGAPAGAPDSYLHFDQLIYAVMAAFPYAVKRGSYGHWQGQSAGRRRVRKAASNLVGPDTDLRLLAATALQTFRRLTPGSASLVSRLFCSAEGIAARLERERPGNPLSPLLLSWADACHHDPLVARDVWLALVPARLDALLRMKGASPPKCRDAFMDALWSCAGERGDDAWFSDLFNILHSEALADVPDPDKAVLRFVRSLTLEA